MGGDEIRTALVTGGARRIGRAIVEDLARHGFAVAIHCNSSVSEARRLAETVIAGGGRAAVLQADLADRDATEKLIGRAAAEFGPVTLLVNSASAFVDDALAPFRDDLFDLHFALHVKAPLILAGEMAAALPEGADGLVVNIVDQRVLKPVPGFFSYGLSKATLHAATITMAQALAPRMRVNAIAPGPTLRSSRQQEKDFQAQLDGLILKRGPALGEFGATIRYLWEARSVTGQTIALDGGQHLGWETPDVAGIPE